MANSITLLALTAFLLKNGPAWLASLNGSILDKGRDTALDEVKGLTIAGGKRGVRYIFHLDEKEQLRHLEQALKNAAERGLATFDTLQERDQYKEIVHTLSQPGPQGEALRKEVMLLFTLAQTPDLAALSDTYNRRQRFFDANHQDIDAAPYLNSFFNALIGELYADPSFRPQLHQVLQLRAAQNAQQSLLDIASMLKRIGETLEDHYSPENFSRDVAMYTEHTERSLRNLKIVGVVPKDQTADPELSGIFVPLRIASREHITSADQQADDIVSALEHSLCLVLLGGPGSGKSTATKYLAWSHAAAQQAKLALTYMPPLLSGQPLPLRIELRRLNEARRHTNYDFLSFATEVLLKREGIDINPQMFKELLTRRGMLLLFDGLDEVATLDERAGLVAEIEHFALCYPGNRVLITSRPVGYELARISHPLFAHADVQNFNDAQIQLYLDNWYAAVLHLPTLPQQEQEERDVLLTTLKENPRLHRLAENPLLLTVITVLHRYERLPDRRVLVYDRCADLLLDTWARLRGTNERWKDMQMAKEDQFTCVAYLGFLLHERSQEEIPHHKGTEDRTVDVTLRFLRQRVADFLKTRELIVEVAEQHKEATRFMDLVQEEAGLIVERGTDESGESLYSFVHRTFQEYFAAVDVYERYQQSENPEVISQFLKEHLHDPHWREVILLLLGKLKFKPVTRQLQQILQGELKSQRSRYTEIVQQDLFFVCDCLIEEIKVEQKLVDTVISQLSAVVKGSWSPSQQEAALEYFGKLMQTRQYAGQGKEELVAFAQRTAVLDGATKLEAMQVLYLYSSPLSDTRQQATSLLLELVRRPDLSSQQVQQNAVFLYQINPKGSDSRQLATMLLMELVKRPDFSSEQVQKTAGLLYWSSSPVGSDVQQQATSLLLELVKRPDLSSEQVRQTAESLYRYSSAGSDVQQQATSLLLELVRRPDLSGEQVWQIAISLYQSSPYGSDAWQQGITLLLELVKRPDLSSEQVRKTAEFLYQSSPAGSDVQQQATSLLLELVKRPDLSSEQVRKTAESFYQYSIVRSDAQQQTTMLLMELVRRPDLSGEQVRKTAESLYRYSLVGSDAQKQATSLLLELVKHPDLSSEQVLETAISLYRSSPYGSDTQLLAITLLLTRLSSSKEIQNKREVYYILRAMVPQFHRLPPVDIQAQVNL